MLLTTFNIIQALLILVGLFYLYQCSVFVFYFARGLIKRENGITRGLLVLYVALLLGGLAVAVDGLILELDIIYGPFGFLALPESYPTPYLVFSSLARLLITLTGVVGNHLLYFSLRKAH